jgi:hypothetical protein
MGLLGSDVSGSLDFLDFDPNIWAFRAKTKSLSRWLERCRSPDLIMTSMSKDGAPRKPSSASRGENHLQLSHFYEKTKEIG